jgi:hypothetical protein
MCNSFVVDQYEEVNHVPNQKAAKLISGLIKKGYLRQSHFYESQNSQCVKIFRTRQEVYNVCKKANFNLSDEYTYEVFKHSRDLAGTILKHNNIDHTDINHLNTLVRDLFKIFPTPDLEKHKEDFLVRRGDQHYQETKEIIGQLIAHQCTREHNPDPQYSSGCEYLIYRDIHHTTINEKLWNSYMKQITEIIKEHPHFYCLVDDLTLPPDQIGPEADLEKHLQGIVADAQNNRLFIYLDKGVLDAFYIVTMGADSEVEIVWSGSRGEGIHAMLWGENMQILYDYVEKHIFADTNVKQILCKCGVNQGKVNEVSREFLLKNGYEYWVTIKNYWQRQNKSLMIDAAVFKKDNPIY